MSDRTALLERITQTPGKCGGRPCIRGMRIRVVDILETLADGVAADEILEDFPEDRKSTRLNSSHLVISYAVFCLKKKNRNMQ